MKGSTALVLLVVLVVLLVMMQPSSSSAARPPAAAGVTYGPYVDWALYNPPAATSGSSGLVDSCHQTFKAGTQKVLSGYGAGSVADAGAKSNPYYYLCDAGGYVVKGAESLYKNTLGRIF